MNEHQRKLGEMPIRKLLIMMSVPAIVGLLINAIYNLVDSMFVGWYVGDLGHSAMAVAMPIPMVIYAIAFMFGVGGASIVSRAIGRKDGEYAQKTINTTLSATAIAGVLITVFGILFLPFLLKLFGAGASNTVLDMAYDYVFYILLAGIYFPLTIVLNNFFRAEGNAVLSMVILLLGAILNIGLDALFLIVFDLGIKGAALATIISQLISFLFALYITLFSKRTLIKIKKIMIDFKILKEVITVGFSSFVRNVIGALLVIFVNYAISQQITDKETLDKTIGLFSIINTRLLLIILLPSFGVVQAMQPIIGYNYGAKKFDRVTQTIKLSFIITTLYFMLLIAVVQIFAPQVLQIFYSKDSLTKEMVTTLRIIILAVPLVATQVIASAIYQAFGKPWEALLLTSLRQLILLVPLVFIFAEIFGLIGIWIAFPVSDIVTSIVSAILLYITYKKLKKLSSETNIDLGIQL